LISEENFHGPNKRSYSHKMAQERLQAPTVRVKEIKSIFVSVAEELKIRLKSSYLTESSPGKLET
jgi:hypothetical protein